MQHVMGALLGLRQTELSQGGSIVDSLAGGAESKLSLSARILEDCDAVDLQALTHLQSRDSAMAACMACVQVRVQRIKSRQETPQGQRPHCGCSILAQQPYLIRVQPVATALRIILQISDLWTLRGFYTGRR